MFSTVLALCRFQPHKAPKTTKPALRAGFLNSIYEEGPLSERLAERERFELSMGQ
jgi:hypothetical protein